MAISRREFIKKVGVATGSLAAASVIPSAVLTGCASTGTGAAAGAVHRGDSPIFQPTKIGSLELKNKMFRAAMLERRNDENGSPTPALLRMYEEFAAGGAAMITTGNIYAFGIRPLANFTRFIDASQIPAYRGLGDVVHRNGAKICAQIVFVGPIDNLYNPASITREDMSRGVAALAQTAVWVQEAGFDAVNLHFAHSYLFSQFFSQYRNTRTDEYGGSLENRTRLAFEAVEAVRRAVGSDFPLTAKIDADEPRLHGSGQEDMNYYVQGLADRGIDAVEISGSQMGTLTRDILSKEDQNFFARDARTIAKSVNVPMILTGGMRNVEMMEEALKFNSKIVGFCMARTLLSEPDLPNKWQNDTNYTPRCISCNWCLDNLFTGDRTLCIFNQNQP